MRRTIRMTLKSIPHSKVSGTYGIQLSPLSSQLRSDEAIKNDHHDGPSGNNKGSLRLRQEMIPHPNLM
jgi:hypothetical protein